jgi:hypothetical protein
MSEKKFIPDMGFDKAIEDFVKNKKDLKTSKPKTMPEKKFIPDMGFEQVLKETVEKRRQKSRPNLMLGFEAINRDFAERKKRLDKELESLPYTTETFKTKELQQIAETKQYLDKYIEEFNQKAQALTKGSPEYILLCNRYIDQTINHLDSLPIWAHKFSTECPGETALEITPNDSIYYTTPSGISLRLKRLIRNLGLGEVIQPFFEKIIFRSRDENKIITEPKLGYDIKEYVTKDFLVLQDQDKIEKDYRSDIRTYYKNNEIYYIEAPETGGVVRSKMGGEHEGTQVNKVFQ